MQTRETVDGAPDGGAGEDAPARAGWARPDHDATAGPAPASPITSRRGNRWRHAVMPVLVGLLVLVVDQATKAWVLGWLADEQEGASWFGGAVSIIHVNNNGAAFGLLAGQMVLFVLIAMVVGAVLIAYYRFLPREQVWLRVSLGLQLGGALGNLLDRVRHGYVVDFVEVHTLPVFNVADAAIVCGVLILAYYLLVRLDRPVPSGPAASTASTEAEPSGGPPAEGGGGATGLPPAIR